MNAKFDGHCRLQKITGCAGIKKGEPILNQGENWNSHISCNDKIDKDIICSYDGEKGENCDCGCIKVGIQSLVEAVKSHAYRHYNEEGGWDFVIETMEDEDIAGLLKGVGEWVECGYNAPVATLEQAIKRLETLISLWDEQRYNYLV